MTKWIFAGAAGLFTLFGAAIAQQAVDGGISMVEANSRLAEEVHAFHNIILMPIITAISLFVLALLLWIVVRYNSKANPVAQKFSHNTMLEVVWTGVPILILLFIALPSFELLYKEGVIPDGRQATLVGDGRASEIAFENAFATPRRRVTRAEHIDVVAVDATGERKLTRGADYTLSGLGDPVVKVALAAPAPAGSTVYVRGGRSRVGPEKILGLFGEDRSEIALAPTLVIKAIGSQWLWTYAYPDFGDFEFTSIMTERDALPADAQHLYRWEVDNRVVVPVGETVMVVTTAKDVIHSWTVPSFAIKVDAVPGRINQTWFKADRVGVYYGQCSEICGVKHSFMPIAVEVVTRPAFEAWVDSQRALAGMEPMFADGARRLADAAPAADPAALD